MHVNRVKYDPELTESLPMVEDERPLYDLSREESGSIVGLFKKIFGSQQVTVSYSRRMWVWTFDDGIGNVIWTLVSNGYGIAWEYLSPSDELELSSDRVRNLSALKRTVMTKLIEESSL